MRVRAVYTTEAAWIMSICLIIVGGAIAASYRIYESSLAYIESIAPEEPDAPLRFREIAAGKNIVWELTGR